MKIKSGGFIPTTLVDYPGEVASVIFLPGCNLKCPYCHNPSIVNSHNEALLPIEKIIESITGRKKLISAVVITGGEPTLYSDLKLYIEKFQKMGLKVKLDTNGTNPKLLKTLSPDYIAMDLKTSIEKYPYLGLKTATDSLLESLNWIKNSNIDYEIRTTAAPIIFNRDDLIELLPILKGVKRYYITNFKNSETLIPSYNENTPYTVDELNDFLEVCRDADIHCILR